MADIETKVPAKTEEKPAERAAGPRPPGVRSRACAVKSIGCSRISIGVLAFSRPRTLFDIEPSGDAASGAGSRHRRTGEGLPGRRQLPGMEEKGHRGEGHR